MRVLIATQHFSPEITAASFRLDAFARAFIERGHEVEVLTAFPNHPEGRIAADYRGRIRSHDQHGPLTVRRSWVWARPRKTRLGRLANYGTYAAGSLLNGLRLAPPDLVLASSPPLPVALTGIGLARRYSVPLVLDVRDLWPESAAALGELEEGRAMSVLRRAERRAYLAADEVVTTNGGFAAHITEVAGPGVRPLVVPNGTTDEWLEAGLEPADRAGAGLPPGLFCWTYAGNIGLAHGIEAAVDAAGLLGDGFRLTIVGEGPRRQAVADRAAMLDPGLVEMRPLCPPADAARVLRASDALLVSEQQPKTISAKLYDYGAIRRPIVAAVGGEMARLVAARKMGLVVTHGSAQEIAAAVRRLRAEPKLAGELTGAAAEFAAAHRRIDLARSLVEKAELIVSATASPDQRG